MTAHSGDVLKGCCHGEWMMVIPKHLAHVIQSDQPKSGHSQETFYFNQMHINQYIFVGASWIIFVNLEYRNCQIVTHCQGLEWIWAKPHLERRELNCSLCLVVLSKFFPSSLYIRKTKNRFLILRLNIGTQPSPKQNLENSQLYLFFFFLSFVVPGYSTPHTSISYNSFEHHPCVMHCAKQCRNRYKKSTVPLLGISEFHVGSRHKNNRNDKASSFLKGLRNAGGRR